MLPAHSRAQYSECQIGVGQQLDVSAIPAKLPYRPVLGASGGPDRPGRAGRRVHVVGCDGQTLPRRVWNPARMDRQPWDVWEAAGSKTATDRIRGEAEEDSGAAHAAAAAGGRGGEDRHDPAGSRDPTGKSKLFGLVVVRLLRLYGFNLENACGITDPGVYSVVSHLRDPSRDAGRISDLIERHSDVA